MSCHSALPTSELTTSCRSTSPANHRVPKKQIRTTIPDIPATIVSTCGENRVYDADGRPVRLELTAGQAADAPMAEKLLSHLRPGATILADKAYDTDAIRNFAKQRKCWANIPAKANRKQTFSFSRWVYRQRNLVKRFFNRIKQMRRLATRYDRLADNYMAALKLAATRIWIASTNESVA